MAEEEALKNTVLQWALETSQDGQCVVPHGLHWNMVCTTCACSDTCILACFLLVEFFCTAIHPANPRNILFPLIRIKCPKLNISDCPIFLNSLCRPTLQGVDVSCQEIHTKYWYSDFRVGKNRARARTSLPDFGLDTSTIFLPISPPRFWAKKYKNNLHPNLGKYWDFPSKPDLIFLHAGFVDSDLSLVRQEGSYGQHGIVNMGESCPLREISRASPSITIMLGFKS